MNDVEREARARALTTDERRLVQASTERDPFVRAAQLRCLIRLTDGRTGRLLYWGRHGEWCQVYVEDRFERFVKSEVVEFIVEGEVAA